MSRYSGFLFRVAVLALTCWDTAFVAEVGCPGNHSPLLEGRYDRPFSCTNITPCPAGFNCHSIAPRRNVCCPDLDINRLSQAIRSEHADRSEFDIEHLQARLSEALIPNLRITPQPQAVSQVRSNANQDSNRAATRRGRLRGTLALTETGTTKHLPIRTAAKSSLERFSCKRQRMDFYCQDKEHRVRRQTQFVVRWYFESKEGKCIQYPWGYCAGEPVASDKSLRTLEECEFLCLPPPSTTPSIEEDPLNATDTAKAQIHGLASRSEEHPLLPSSELSTSTGTTTPTLISSQPVSRRVPDRCLRVSPYRRRCRDGQASQFAIRWFYKAGGCFAYPYGFCNDVQDDPLGEPAKTEADCIARCTEHQ